MGKRKEVLEAAAKNYGHGDKIIPVQADITSKSDIESAYKTISAKDQYVHLLVNNAGISGPWSKTEATETSSIKEDLFHNSEFHEWDATYRLNVASQYFMTYAFLPLLKKASQSEKSFSASIMNTASVSGITKESQNHLAYNSSKVASIHLTRLLATELVRGRNANVITNT